VHANIQIIVTQNLSDFTDRSLQPYGIQALHPDAFLLALLKDDPDALENTIIEQAAALRNPPLTVLDVLSALAVHVPRFVKQIETTFPTQE
jgi:hypothetical protein